MKAKSLTMRKKLLLCASMSALLSPGVSLGQNIFDIFFLTDTTGSMGGLISGVQSSSESIIDAFLTRGDVRFGVGEYKDDRADPFGFRYNLVADGLPILSSDRAAVVTAINQWTASGGGDGPEDNLLGLRETAVSTPWRDGARKIIFWFGDAPGHDPASDGTTLSSTLAALAANCIQVIAIDLGDLDSTDQATAITSAILDCGLDGGQIAELNLSGLTPEQAAERIEQLLIELFEEQTGGGLRTAQLSSLRTASISLSRTLTRDVGSRLFRLRSGVRPGTVEVVTTAPSDPKGGLAKNPVTTTVSQPYRWEVYGQLVYFSESQDAQSRGNRLVHPKTTIDTFGGLVGFEYDFDSTWAAGLAIGLANTDIRHRGIGKSDIDSFALIPYVSYYRGGAVAGGDFYADLLYAYTDHDYDTRNGNQSASTDGKSHQLEFNAGLNFKGGTVVHGPYASLRWLDGEIDGYQFSANRDVDYESLATQLGYQASFPITVAGGTLVPQVRGAWEHEFEHNQGHLAGIPTGSLPEDVAVLGAGIGYYLNSGWNVVLDYEARLASKADSHYVSLKVGKEF